MFENNNEKGLFTFYWEQTHRQPKKDEVNTFSLQPTPANFKFSKKKRTEMEEKQNSRARPQKPARTKYNCELSAETYCSTPSDKENRECLMPSTLDIPSKLLAKQLEQQCSSEMRSTLQKHKQQNSCKLPFIKSTFSPQYEEIQTNQASSQKVQKLVLKDDSFSPRQLTIQLQTENAKGASFQRSPCLKKCKKMHSKRQKSLRIVKKLSANFCPDDLGQTNKLSPRELPVATPRTLRAKRTRQGNTFQKTMGVALQKMLRGQENGQSAVINIGVTNHDEYRQHWMKKKQEFLSLLARNMQKL